MSLARTFLKSLEDKIGVPNAFGSEDIDSQPQEDYDNKFDTEREPEEEQWDADMEEEVEIPDGTEDYQ